MVGQPALNVPTAHVSSDYGSQWGLDDITTGRGNTIRFGQGEDESWYDTSGRVKNAQKEKAAKKAAALRKPLQAVIGFAADSQNNARLSVVRPSNTGENGAAALREDGGGEIADERVAVSVQPVSAHRKTSLPKQNERLGFEYSIYMGYLNSENGKLAVFARLTPGFERDIRMYPDFYTITSTDWAIHPESTGDRFYLQLHAPVHWLEWIRFLTNDWDSVCLKIGQALQRKYGTL